MNRTIKIFCLIVIAVFIVNPLMSERVIANEPEIVSAHLALPHQTQKNGWRTYRTRRPILKKIAISWRSTASWYSQTDPGIHRRTANGEVFDDSKQTCAAWNIPFGTYLKITNTKNGKSVICRVNDRGPQKHLGRQIDLSKGAFRKIADLQSGLIKVSIVPVFEWC